jgi:hypothetical protein
MGAVDEAGGSAFLLTLTVRRDRGGRLGLTKEERARLRRLEENRSHYEAANSNLWHFDEREAEADAIEDNSLRQRKGCWDFRSDAWARVTSGGAWQAHQELFGGLLGWARVVEVTDGENGWHVHIHALICFGEQVSTELVAGSVGARMFARWRAARRWRSGLLLHQDRPRGQRVAPQGGPPLGWPDSNAAPRRCGRHLRGDGYGAVVGVGEGQRGPPPAHLVLHAGRRKATRSLTLAECRAWLAQLDADEDVGGAVGGSAELMGELAGAARGPGSSGSRRVAARRRSSRRGQRGGDARSGSRLDPLAVRDACLTVRRAWGIASA